MLVRLLPILALLGLAPAAQTAPAAYTTERKLVFVHAPADNPLKGFVAYANHHTNFPHSLEWDYLPVSDVMYGPASFDWAALEERLIPAAARGHAFYPRFFLEYPGRPTGIPRFLLDAGVRTHRWVNPAGGASPEPVQLTPDYSDPRLRQALRAFIREFGRRYDGDPRLAFVGLGLLGTWGEWHDYPHADWFASKEVQTEVLDAYEAAFRTTRLVTRYPAGRTDPVYASNAGRRMGYHDDSFAWDTLDTGDPALNWYLIPRMDRAGVRQKWRREMIGGEVRPELWGCLFQGAGCGSLGQDFDRCVAMTHVSWLCFEPVFRPEFPADARAKAERVARGMGYEIHVATVRMQLRRGRLDVRLTAENTGTAPFYYDWKMELAALDSAGRLHPLPSPDWHLADVQPGLAPAVWNTSLRSEDVPDDVTHLELRVPNPLPAGSPVRFANREQDADVSGWLSLGPVPVPRRTPLIPSAVPSGTSAPPR